MKVPLRAMRRWISEDFPAFLHPMDPILFLLLLVPIALAILMIRLISKITGLSP